MNESFYYIAAACICVFLASLADGVVDKNPEPVGFFTLRRLSGFLMFGAGYWYANFSELTGGIWSWLMP